MAVITATDTKSISEVTVTKTILGVSDTFVYSPGVTKYLVIDNVTAGSLTPNIDGDGSTSQFAPGVGNVSLTAGYTFGSIGAGVTKVIDLDQIKSYLKGVITVTGGAGAEAYILEV